jgi:hypothetical protein
VGLFALIPCVAYADNSYSYGEGAGNQTCGDFAEMYRVNTRAAEGVYFSWAEGFMTGWNIALMPKGEDVPPSVNLKAVPIEQQRQHIRDYCDEHPLTQYAQAVADLYAWIGAEAKASKH